MTKAKHTTAGFADSVGRQLVSIVNPRLVLYTRAGFLAGLILLINYAVIGAGALFLVQLCTEVSVTEKSEPTTYGGGDVFWSFMNKTVEREGVVRSGPVTITTNVSACFKGAVRTVVAPFPAHTRQQGWGWAASTYATYVGSGVTYEMPCWQDYIPCVEGRPAFNGKYFEMSRNNMPCGDSPFPELAQRFPWCSSEDEWEARVAYETLKNLPSDRFSGTANLAQRCGNGWFVAPGGVNIFHPDSYKTGASPIPIPRPHFSPSTPFTTYWELTVTTTTKTCPTFTAAFANAFAFTAQIEIVVTVVLVFVFGKAGVIKLNNPAKGIVTAKSAVGLATEDVKEQVKEQNPAALAVSAVTSAVAV